MKNIRVIPRLDIKGPNLVKGVHLEGLRVLGDPSRFARYYYENGADEIIYQDTVASLYDRNSLTEIINKTAKEIFIPLTVGGGIRDMNDIHNVLRAGADKVSINTAAVRNPDFVNQASRFYGSSTIVIAVDAKKNGDKSWNIFTHGGRKPTDIDALEYCIEVANLGAGEILLTSMDRDGTKIGFDNELLSTVSSSIDIPVIASGGVGNLEHFVEGVLKGGASALLAASIFHFGEYSIKDVKTYLAEQNIAVRI